MKSEDNTFRTGFVNGIRGKAVRVLSQHSFNICWKQGFRRFDTVEVLWNFAKKYLRSCAVYLLFCENQLDNLFELVFRKGLVYHLTYYCHVSLHIYWTIFYTSREFIKVHNEQQGPKEGSLRYSITNVMLFRWLRIKTYDILPSREIVLQQQKPFTTKAILLKFTEQKSMLQKELHRRWGNGT